MERPNLLAPPTLKLFSAPVALSVVSGPGSERSLAAQERAMLGAMSAARRRDFVLGRTCARLALSAFHPHPPAVGRGVAGAPSWPSGFRGSIAHAQGVACAAVCRARTMLGVGVDIEAMARLDNDLVQSICRTDELAAFPGRAPEPGASWPLIAFVAKEAVFKALHPIFGRFLELHDVSIRFMDGRCDQTGAFRLAAIGQGLQSWASSLRGRWALEQGFVFAGAEFCVNTPGQGGPEVN